MYMCTHSHTHTHTTVTIHGKDSTIVVKRLQS